MIQATTKMLGNVSSMVLPGNYACQQSTGSYTVVVTFQTFAELMEYLRSIEPDRASVDAAKKRLQEEGKLCAITK